MSSDKLPLEQPERENTSETNSDLETRIQSHKIDLECDCCDRKVIYKETIDNDEETCVRVYCPDCDLILDYEML